MSLSTCLPTGCGHWGLNPVSLCLSHYTLLPYTKAKSIWRLNLDCQMWWFMSCNVISHYDINTCTLYDSERVHVSYRLIFFQISINNHLNEDTILTVIWEPHLLTITRGSVICFPWKTREETWKLRPSLTQVQSLTAAAAQRGLCPTAVSWFHQQGEPTERESIWNRPGYYLYMHSDRIVQCMQTIQ